MEEEYVGPIRIGRIARSIERALSLSLTGEVAVYMNQEDLDALASRRPGDYLLVIQELCDVLKNPDFVGFCEEKEVFTYMKFYFREDGFYPFYLFVGRKGIPGKWFFLRMGMGRKNAVPEGIGVSSFVRPLPRKVETIQSDGLLGDTGR